jgi:hypothetical protein
VTATMGGDKWPMRDRELLTLDEAGITVKAREPSTAAWQRYGDMVSLSGTRLRYGEYAWA